MSIRAHRRLRCRAAAFSLSAVLATAAHAAPPGGYSLEDRWDQILLALGNRSGRPRPFGPLLQRFVRSQSPEYDLDLAMPEFDRRAERAWAQSIEGARFWVQSLDEFLLANRVQIKTRTPVGDHAAVGLRYDRLDVLEANHSIVRVDLIGGELGERGKEVGAYARMTLQPRLEKDDSDLEAAVGYRSPKWGHFAARLLALDPFTNASLSLAEARDRELQVRVEQNQPHFVVAGQAVSEPIRHVRGELFAGRLFPAATDLDFSDSEQSTRLQIVEAWLAGSLIEWHPGGGPVRLGSSVLFTDASTIREFDTMDREDDRIDERTVEQTVYALTNLTDELTLDLAYTTKTRPQRRRIRRAPELDPPVQADETRLIEAEIQWMPTKVFGVEIAYLGVDRDTSERPEFDLDGTGKRLTTRLVLRVGSTLWTAFGVGWDLDPGDQSIYDGGGMTMRLDWSKP